MQFWTLLFKNQTHFVCSTLLYTTFHRSDITNFKLLKVVNIYIKAVKISIFYGIMSMINL